jgi:Flp pilus assembly protein CpaB
MPPNPHAGSSSTGPLPTPAPVAGSASGSGAGASTTRVLPHAGSTGGSGGPRAAAAPPGGGGGKVAAIGIVLAIVAVILMNIHVEVVRRQARPGEFTVYRLENRVRVGDTLRERDVRAVRMPEDFREAFHNAVDPTGLRARIGQPFKRAAERGGVLTYDLFIDADEANLDRLISRDMRLVALPVNARTLPGNLRPGMFVDIEAPFVTGAAGGPRVMPVMEFVRVMAVGRRSVIDEQADAEGRQTTFSTISIEVTPEQATQLAMIQSVAAGDFMLHLRNPADTSQPKIPMGGINPAVLSLIDQPRSVERR